MRNAITLLTSLASLAMVPMIVAAQDVTLLSRAFGTSNAANGVPGFATNSLSSGVSACGRFVVFTSNAVDLLGSGNADGSYNVFLHDGLTGTTTLVSHAFGNPGSPAGGYGGVISANGEFVAFLSTADLVTGTVPVGYVNNVYLWERATGTIVLVSHVVGNPVGRAGGGRPLISADGAYVAFESSATALVTGVDGNGGQVDVFLYERATGTVTLVSHVPGMPANSGNWGSGYGKTQISADASYVVFESGASNLVAGFDANGTSNDVFVYERATGTVTLVNHTWWTGGTTGDRGAFDPVISGDGAVVAFHSSSTDLVAGTTAPVNISVFVFERATGAVKLASHVPGSATIAGNGYSYVRGISADGGRVLVESNAPDLVAGWDFNDATDVFVYEHATDTMRLVSHLPWYVGYAGNAFSRLPVISPDGAMVAFLSAATDLVPGTDTNGVEDLFHHELATGATRLVSHVPGQPRAAAGSGTTNGYLSTDGTFLAFSSGATNLTTGTDTNQGLDVFVYERVPDTTAPDTVIHIGPSGTTTDTAATFVFSGSDDFSGSVLFECALDAAPFAFCSAPKSYAGLAVGAHTFQVRAIDQEGNQDASPATKTWTIVPPPTAPNALTATAVSSSQIDLTWADTSTDETGFTVERCTGVGCTAFVQIASLAANTNSYTSGGLSPNATYTYRVRAFHDFGASAYSTTAAATTLPPAAPSGLTATASLPAQINLAWVDNSNDEIGFVVERCAGAGCSSFVPIASLGPNVAGYSNTGLTASTTYTYRVQAAHPTGNSSYSNTATATTPVTAAPSGLTATAVSQSRIDLTWVDNATDETGFVIQRCSGAACSNFVQIASVGANVVSYSNTLLSENTTYSYRVQATHPAGNSAYSNTATASTPATPLAAPTNLVATAVSASQINLAWDSNADNQPDFRVERCQGAGCTNFAVIATVGGGNTSYSNTGLTANATYTYRVQALNGATTSAYSNTASATTQASAPAVPTAPSGLNATAVSSSSITLTWTDNSSNETSFKIERCTGAGCTNFAQIASLGANVSSYSNTGLAASTTYTYRVRASNAGGNSAYSNSAAATTQAAAPTPVPSAPSALNATAVSSSSITLAWTDNSSNETSFKIERCTGAGCTNFAQIASLGANVSSYSNTGLAASTTYTYRVRASNAGGNSAYSNTAAATTQAAAPGPTPSAPSALTATATSSSVSLTWADNSSNETGFKVERCEGGGCNDFSLLTTVAANATSYVDGSANGSGNEYVYRVRAYNAAGDSAPSNTASSTIP